MQPPQAQAATAEVGEGRERAQGNAGQQPRGRTQRRAALSRALDRGRQAAKASAIRVPALWPHVHSRDRRREASARLHHDAAPGGDGQTGAADGAQLDTHLRDLADRRKRGAYHAPPVARVSLPKAEGRQRPMGQPTLADQSVQRATVEGLNPVDEPAWRGFSDGDRPGRSPPPALEAGTVGLAKRQSNWGRAAASRGFYDARDHAGLV